MFGHFGDKYGRKKLLQFAILLVGAVTFLMGCLPTYAQIGVWAPVLLVVLRFLQGFAVGGEWGGAVLLVAEHSPNKSRAFWASWPQAAVPVGNMLATVVLWVLTATLSDEDFLSWGWRVAFWLSAVVVLVGYYIRTKVTDAPIFVAAQEEVERAKAVSYGVFEVLKRYPRGVFTAMGLRFAENVMYYLVVIVSITYLKVQVGVDTTAILKYMLVAHAVHFAVIPLVGRLADRVGRRPVYVVGTVLAATWGFFAFPMMDSAQLSAHHRRHRHRPGDPRADVRAAAGDHGRDVPDPDAVFRCVPWLSGHLDRGGLRSRPRISVKLLEIYDSWVPIAIYLAISAAITLVAVFYMRETKGLDLETIDEADRERPGEGRGRMTALEGRTALVTGGASGIGAACARELAARGAVVTVADLDDVGAKTVAEEIGGKPWAVDLSEVGSLEQLRLEIDILVNNAGIQHVSPIVDFPPDRFRLIQTLMVEAPFLLIRAALPYMYDKRFRAHRQHLVGPRVTRVGVQGRLRHGQARTGGAVQGDRARGWTARCDEQLRQSRLCANAVGDQADRRSGSHARHSGAGGGGGDPAEGERDQATPRT